ncbi:C3a anaphylatoxin chemotactic receptor-like [Engystomops pustulosus]|uniref:C3a anaphylatoxin chemotactic receptor-like n=1 Tax=Engystomops pustulosus TaxID=76066 RepID=UPI003AFB1264
MDVASNLGHSIHIQLLRCNNFPLNLTPPLFCLLRSFAEEHKKWSDEDFLFYIYGPYLRVTSVTLFSIVFILGIIGNGLVIWIAGFRMKKTINAVWFLHLAIADFLCCVSLPLRLEKLFYFFTSTGLATCISSIIVFSINMSASVLLLTAMSIDRWVSVMWPFWAKVHRTQKQVRITAGIIWGLSFLISGSLITIHWFVLNDFSEWCYEVPYYICYRKTVYLIRFIIMFVIPFLIIFTSYVTIFLKLRKSKRRQRSQRSYKIITAVILCFFICWAPYYIWPLTFNRNNNWRQFHLVNTIISGLASLNSCINPIIYVFMGQDFRQGFLRSIPFRVARALDEDPDAPDREGEDCEPAPNTDV